MEKSYKKILVISLQGIGDLLLVTPLLSSLKKGFPVSSISVLTLSKNKEILTKNPDVDNIITFDHRNKHNIFKIIPLILSLRKQNFELSICAYPSGLRSALLGYLTGAKKRLGHKLSLFKRYSWLFTNKAEVKEIKHALLLNLDLLNLLEIDSTCVNTNLVYNVSDKDKEFAADFLSKRNTPLNKPVISMHPGGGRYKSWPKERFARVADMLIEEFKATILFIGAEVEKDHSDKIISLMKNTPLNAVGACSLGQSAALMQKSKILICNNSGPMHIAASLHIPTISISGPVDKRIYSPWGSLGHIVLQKELECAPCYYSFLRDTLPETKRKNMWVGKTHRCNNNHLCLEKITENDVMEAVRTLITANK